MPEFTPQQIDDYRTNRAILEALDRQMKFDRPLLIVKAKPRKKRTVVPKVLTEQPSKPNVPCDSAPEAAAVREAQGPQAC